MTQWQALRGELLGFHRDPGDSEQPRANSLTHYPDGVVLIRDGVIEAVDHYAAMAPHLDHTVAIAHYPGQLIMPGFIDPHLHFSQLDIIASHGRQLIDWLNTYTFPEEIRLNDRDYAEALAEGFIQQLLAHGTTTALAFCTSHPNSVNALFERAERERMRLIAGKVMMDRNAPEALCDTVDSSIRDSRALMRHWHGRGRLEYAVTPRFAPTSTPEQLTAAGRLWREDPGMVMQTHLCENRAEIEWVAELYPEAKDYLDVYQRAGLLGPRSVFAHAIHIDDDMRTRLRDGGGAIAFCPSSNTFLGSGLFDRRAARAAGVPVGLATDIGAGTSLSQLTTLSDAYKVCQLQGDALTPWQAFDALTRGNAQMLGLADRIGRLAPGLEADLVVLDPASTPLMARKQAHGPTLAEKLFNLMMLGDDRTIRATWVMGRLAYERA
ncbi:guanine deaminase [Kushneria phosphatilytica]|uniref:Guanine deaminase n=1 Tax=Kushneria phosphatilytica TaxID=657387 RepID=A0A5C1A4D1_9GAMM|nr:guanine deaminase [Kushneria phosphatilytica]QEL12493.1 guanine deaminase [Kushneria phosphatilytica]